ncbi:MULTISPECIES: DUF935 domain-containing protein [unclassified Acinetobacter]|uniref:DUF935 domain-containing protein n=1 Tax=unclassified Acinetobacter TaxID=196816 RepID=UPI00190BD655|nr:MULTISPECIES: DUF935 domain-containing protein [unclassified Acinetobacter]MBK0062395.1 DUF935 domain-containing protein [Acinetobacter sp. S55]MBK0066199.1 DUF935 domain-containing protein [Acinetobacter sp. S54]
MAKKKSKAKDDRSALDAPQTADVGWINQQEHPTNGLTPSRLAQLLIAAESGDLSAQADLGADMEEKDGHIFSELSKRKKAINELDWEVKPPKNATDQEKKIASEVHEWIDDIDDLEMIFFDALDAIGHGYSCQAIEWEKVGSLILPKSFEHRLAREFKTPTNQPNELRWVKNGVEEELWDYGWLTHYHKAKSGYISRSGLHRVLCYPYVFKNYGMADVLRFLEVYGLPIRIGSYPAGATKEEKWTLLKAVLSIGRDAGGIIPQGMKIDFQNAASGDTDNHMGLIKYCDQTESKIIVGGTLLSDVSGKTSTNAQSKTHEIGFETIIKSDAKQLGRSITGTLISYLMRLNFPNITPDRYPKFKFDVSDIEDIETYAKAIPELVDVGMQIPLEWVHTKLGIPQPDSKDVPVLSRIQPQQQAANRFNFKGFKLASLSQQLQQNLYQDQALLDQAMNQLDSGQINAQAQAIIAPILKQLEPAKTIDEALGIIAEIAPGKTMDQMQEMLTKLIFSAEVWGAIAVQSELS